MDPTSSHPMSAGTRAITIPVPSSNATSSHHPSNQTPRRRAYPGRRPSRTERADSDMGNTSASSLGSDWTSSPISPQSNDQSRLGFQVSVASPSIVNHTKLVSSTPTGQLQRKDKQRATSTDLPPNVLPPLFTSSQSPLGPSMLSSSAYKSVNLNSHHDPDSKEPPRLITYTKHSQGFTWNDELFLPSYLLGRNRYRGHGGSGIRRRWIGDEEDDDMGDFEEEGERCPVTDIFVTDEEAAAMMP